MQFKQIDIENFGTIKSVSLKLENRGLVLVTGRNEDTAKADSNGAGKSLLLDAFCWCLWGRTIREDKDDDVVNRRVGKNCKVAVKFVEKGKEFVVIRYRKHEESKKPNDLELFLSGVDLSASSMKMTQQVINNVVGLSFETFCAMMPGSGKNAAQMTDGDIKELLENILQLTAMAKARSEAEERLKKLRTEIVGVEGALSGITKQLERDRKQLTDYTAESLLYDEKKQQKLNSLLSEQEEVKKQLEDTEKIVQTGETTELEVARLVEKRKALSDLFVRNQNICANLEGGFSLFRENIHHQVLELSIQLKNSKSELSKLSGLGSVCSECRQTIPEEHTSDWSKKLLKEISSFEAQIAEHHNVIQTKEQKLADDVLPYQNELKRLDSEIELVNLSIRKCSPAVEAARDARASLSGLEKALQRVSEQVAELQAEESPYGPWISKTEKAIEDGLTEHKNKTTELDDLMLLKKKLEFWKHAFSPAGIRSFILDNVTPVLNEKAGHYCKVLTDGEMCVDFSTKTQLKSGEWREKFNINIQQEHGGSTYKSNSKGEKQRANLAVCFAFSDLAEMHSNKKLDFRFLDEPFEGIDESGTDAVVALLQEQQSKYPTVFVVTHQSHFKDIFPQEITMVKKDGMSYLEEKNGGTTTIGST